MTKKVFVLLETIGVFLLGSALAIVSIRIFGMQEWLDKTGMILSRSPIDFNALSERTLVSTGIKYAWIFLLMIGLGYVLKVRITPKSLGLTTNGLSFGRIMKYALLILCVGGILPKIVFALWPSGILGPGLDHWHILQESWDGPFWVFMLISSIVIPPIVEELFFRGYMQSRFHMVFKPRQAILMTAVIFTLFHTQYLIAETIHLLMLVGLFIGAWLLSFIRHKSGSLYPGLIAHALVNIPVIGNSAWVVAALMFGILIYFWGRKDPLFNLKLENNERSKT